MSVTLSLNEYPVSDSVDCFKQLKLTDSSKLLEIHHDLCVSRKSSKNSQISIPQNEKHLLLCR